MDNEIVNRIRDFNRYYVRVIGLLDSSILNTGYSLTEAHVLNILYTHPGSTATFINKELNLDEGYLSRVIKKLIKKSLIIKEQSLLDKRAFMMNLSDKGKSEYLKLDYQSSSLVQTTIKHLSTDEKSELANLLDKAKLLLVRH